jgi:hypothetical protein
MTFLEHDECTKRDLNVAIVLMLVANVKQDRTPVCHKDTIFSFTS